MYSLGELHAQLAAFREKLAEATGHTNRALELLDEARETIVTAFEQAEPWLPPQLAAAEERLRHDAERLAAADQLVTAYQASL
ncbi:hypothetical protein [Amycolatopsis pithecellobii]|uniref:Uncharacterized protein n=1 Tax=Amycolatopsis pithecellobii TaxID=664692 RepID=A0A6N7Z9M2_9PSEU|nr:hypothetical protein [Amycolatopsis pithecellobii]MTD58431.1 hypothetical protein [Amycolatopsis pithecellobii]